MCHNGDMADYPLMSAIAETKAEIIVPETSEGLHTQKATL
jgi:hypothetical protein